MNTPNNDTLRDLIAKQPNPEVSKDFVARTVAAARGVEQDPAASKIVRGPWLKIASLAAAAAVVLAISLDALNPTPGTEVSVAIADTEDVDLAVLVADAQLPEDRQDMQLMLVLDDNAEISDDDLLAFAL